jgi:hypothetical protein
VNLELIGDWSKVSHYAELTKINAIFIGTTIYELENIFLYVNTAKMWSRAMTIYDREGFTTLLGRTVKFVYNNHVRPYFPQRNYSRYCGVRTCHSSLAEPARLFDGFVPWTTPSELPDYKVKNVALVQDVVSDGDSVTIIGGGEGVTAVTAARQVGPKGYVTVYEGDAKRVDDIRRTIELNELSDRFSVVHAVVGTAHLVANDEAAKRISPEQLPTSDVVEMDCEGAELDILKNLQNQPRAIVVETHHTKEYSPYSNEGRIARELKSKGYEINHYDGPWVDGIFKGKLAENT